MGAQFEKSDTEIQFLMWYTAKVKKNQHDRLIFVLKQIFREGGLEPPLVENGSKLQKQIEARKHKYQFRHLSVNIGEMGNLGVPSPLEGRRKGGEVKKRRKWT